jgi:flavin-binding protein dodecin
MGPDGHRYGAPGGICTCLSSVRKRCHVAVIKTIDLVGVSTESWRDAAQQALEEAARTIRGITGMDVLDTSCTVENGSVSEYLTHVRIKFRIER